MQLPLITNNCCHSAYCWAENETDPTVKWFGPCWGGIQVIDEDYWEDGYDWVHACEGHLDRWKEYIRPPDV